MSACRSISLPLYAVLTAFTAIVAGCSGNGGFGGGNGKPYFKAKHEPWRAQVETACLNSGLVRSAPWIATKRGLGGPGVCGAIRPFRVAAASNGTVALNPPAILRCPMIPAVDRWMNTIVQPAASRHFGSRVVDVKVAASYGCRPRNNKHGGKLSEHGFANALDVSTFHFANGRSATVKEWRRGPSNTRAFLREVHRGSCRVFTTVLGPNADRYHHDHFHLDLARHGRHGTRRYCR
ncbi:MAG: extensin family protein [Hyphomicrobiaceae bacterium]